MNTINDGGTAFPVWELNGKGQPEMTGFGMSLRDYFAAKAMQGWLASYPATIEARVAEQAAYVTAHLAYKIADAMLKAREASND